MEPDVSVLTIVSEEPYRQALVSIPEGLKSHGEEPGAFDGVHLISNREKARACAGWDALQCFGSLQASD